MLTEGINPEGDSAYDPFANSMKGITDRLDSISGLNKAADANRALGVKLALAGHLLAPPERGVAPGIINKMSGVAEILSKDAYADADRARKQDFQMLGAETEILKVSGNLENARELNRLRSKDDLSQMESRRLQMLLAHDRNRIAAQTAEDRRYFSQQGLVNEKAADAAAMVSAGMSAWEKSPAIMGLSQRTDRESMENYIVMRDDYLNFLRKRTMNEMRFQSGNIPVVERRVLRDTDAV